MKTACVCLLLGVCVLLLSALTVSAVSLSVSPNLQQVFSGSSSVSLSCVDDGQTADGWTVKRTRGGLTEDCGAAAGVGRLLGSYCVLDRSVSFGGSYFCENSSGQQSDEVSISVSDKHVILEIPALPVRTGSNMTLRCRQRNGDTVRAYFFINGSHVGSESISELTITNVQQADEGLYWCATDTFGESHQSFLRVRACTSPDTSACPCTVTPSPPPSSSSSSPITPMVASLVSVIPLVLVVLGALLLYRKLKGRSDSSPPPDVTYADVSFTQRASRTGKQCPKKSEGQPRGRVHSSDVPGAGHGKSGSGGRTDPEAGRVEDGGGSQALGVLIKARWAQDQVRQDQTVAWWAQAKELDQAKVTWTLQRRRGDAGQTDQSHRRRRGAAGEVLLNPQRGQMQSQQIRSKQMDSSRPVVMKYGQKTSRWKRSLNMDTEVGGG
ncbi:unnamed protein product [Oreochromis niloticus]|nr:unnamed protein product [Mustela putorius furo]